MRTTFFIHHFRMKQLYDSRCRLFSISHQGKWFVGTFFEGAVNSNEMRDLAGIQDASLIHA